MAIRSRKGKGKPAIPLPPGVLPGMPPGAQLPAVPPTKKMTAQQRKLNEMLKSLMTICASLSIKVAACGCTKRAKCGVYLKGKEIAKIIDKMQDLRVAEKKAT